MRTTGRRVHSARHGGASPLHEPNTEVHPPRMVRCCPDAYEAFKSLERVTVPELKSKLLITDEGKNVGSCQLSDMPSATFGRNSQLVDFPVDHASLSREHAAVLHRDSASFVRACAGCLRGANLHR